MTDPGPAGGYRFIPADTASRVCAIGPSVRAEDAHGEFIGMAMFSRTGAQQLRETYRRLQRVEGTSALERATFPHIMQAMVNDGVRIDVVDIYKGWMEVDTFDDYRRLWARTEPL